MPTRSVIHDQIGRLDELYGKASEQNYNVTSGIYGEEARFKKGIGASIAAGGGGVKGTYGYAPLFEASANFAGQRIQARTAAQQAKIMNMIRISQGYNPAISSLLQDDRLQLEREKFEYEKEFNFGDILGLLNVSTNINPFNIASGLFSNEQQPSVGPSTIRPASGGIYNTPPVDTPVNYDPSLWEGLA